MYAKRTKYKTARVVSALHNTMTNVFRITWCNTFDTFYPLKRMIRVCFILLCQQCYVKSSVSSFSRSIYSHYIGCRVEPQFGYFCFSVKHTHNLLKLSSIILSIVLESRGGKFVIFFSIFSLLYFLLDFLKYSVTSALISYSE